ncbi:hypothetical protein M413DRAFT_14578 [Hebeloma cylindrosporum]|uniref:Uncharacterized protein n=1 Tax=Hebeloma cylindrosporum TaxID=76867 RepID=A0A0C2XBU3_HEBCY|nr:hypothetical protein M413DRAFT_14578 [Hebeloma cylindrosporum h7]
MAAALTPPSMVLSSHSDTHLRTIQSMPGYNQRTRRSEMDIRNVEDHQTRNVHMFSNAQNLSIRDTAIHNVGRDLMIINNNYTYWHEPCRLHQMHWEENAVEDALQFPPLNARILTRKTSISIPGVTYQTR